MKHKIKLGVIATLSLLTMMMSGCSFSVGTTPDSAKANTNTASSNKAASNSGSNSAGNTATAPKKDDNPQAKLENEKKPEGKANKVKEVSVPADWIYHYDEKRGYGFSLPAGSTGESNTVDGVDVFVAATPTPSEIALVVFAFKDEKLTKENLLKESEKALKEMGFTIQTGKLTGESDDYAVAEANMTRDNDGAKSKVKILVATDVTDNYVMIVGTEEAKYAANEKIIDQIWGSFEMWSGGSTGNN